MLQGGNFRVESGGRHTHSRPCSNARAYRNGMGEGSFQQKEHNPCEEDWEGSMRICRKTRGEKSEELHRAWEEYVQRLREGEDDAYKIRGVDPIRLHKRVMKKGTKAMGLDLRQGCELKCLPLQFRQNMAMGFRSHRGSSAVCLA